MVLAQVARPTFLEVDRHGDAGVIDGRAITPCHIDVGKSGVSASVGSRRQPSAVLLLHREHRFQLCEDGHAVIIATVVAVHVLCRR